MSGLILPGRQVFIVDTHVNLDPTRRAAGGNHPAGRRPIARLRPHPKVALLSHSNFGSSDAPSALKMRETLGAAARALPDLEVDGEMHGDCALDEAARKAILPDSTLHGSANLLVCPNLDSANIAYNC
jgi:malate dehydrogenase (oxaloacetate-decarboxylating)(NADP+)